MSSSSDCGLGRCGTITACLNCGRTPVGAVGAGLMRGSELARPNAPERVSWYRRAVEAERRAERADSEVAALRAMVRALAAHLDAVPGLDLAEKRLLEEANVLAGSAPVG